jgi:glycosyltransferase involved in cell wall biosynthesis
MNILFSHPTGNGNVRAALRGFHRGGILEEFITSFASFEGDFVDMLGEFGPFREIHRRRFDAELKSKTSIWPWREIGRQVASKIGIRSLTRHETAIFCVDSVYRSLDRRMARRLSKLQSLRGVYAYDDGARMTFNTARQLGISCFYDLPTGYWRSARRLLTPELVRRPEWAATITGFADSQAKLESKDREIELADHIFVASSFTARTLHDYPGKVPPVHVIPYGFPPIGEERSYERNIKNRPLKVLFVGKLSQQKGIADLIEAVENLGSKVELTLVGRKAVHDCPALNAAVEKHRWIPSIPNEAVIKLMREHDVFVFPSLFDGFGMVVTEAMSQGTPVIASDRCAGPDLIRHGENGWLVEAGAPRMIQNILEHLIEHPEEVAACGRAARETARLRPWEVYGKELANAVSQLMTKHN